jgi:hypothetical protein
MNVNEVISKLMARLAFSFQTALPAPTPMTVDGVACRGLEICSVNMVTGRCLLVRKYGLWSCIPPIVVGLSAETSS